MMSLGILSALIRLLLQLQLFIKTQDLFCSGKCVMFSPRVRFHDELGAASRQGRDEMGGRVG